MSEGSLSYRDAGVDIDAAHRALGGIKEMVRSTRTAGALSDVGSFGGLFAVPSDLQEPVLVASTDGVGTKLKIAFMTGRHDTVGEDLVNHCVNDILVQGAFPLFFLDYLGVGKVEPGVVESLVDGVARGCRANGCTLLGGETAEMPDFYAPGEYDLAGTIVGAVEKGRIIDGSAVAAGDVILGLPSSGLHTNGYSLARKIIFERLGLGVNDQWPDLGGTVSEVLLRVHRSYLAPLRPLIQANRVKALAHITGGGITDNLPRVLPEGVAARIDTHSWSVPPLFQALQAAGKVDTTEMYRAFNMGMGMAVIVGADEAEGVIRDLAAAGEEAWIAGEAIAGEQNVVYS